MDIMVAYIPPKFGMLLSRYWEAKVKGTMYMDLTYATIPVFGEKRRLYREKRMAYIVSSKEKPHNFPIYVIDIELGFDILFNELTDEAEDEKKTENQQIEIQETENQQISEDKVEGWWLLHFDGSTEREGDGVGIWMTTPEDESELFS